MNITPEQADHWVQTATDGPWYVHTDPDGTLIHDDTGNMCIAVEQAGSDYREADLHLAAAAPDLARTIAEMRWQWGVRTDAEEIWADTPDQQALVEQAAAMPGNHLLRRLVGPWR